MKAFKVIVFFNGDTKHKGSIVYLNFRNCKNWDQLMEEVARSIPFVGVSIRHIFNAANYQPVTTFTDLFDGINLIASGTEPLVMTEYHLMKKEDIDKELHFAGNSHNEVIQLFKYLQFRNQKLLQSIQTATTYTWDFMFQSLNFVTQLSTRYTIVNPWLTSTSC